MLGVRDDVELRRAEQAYAIAIARQQDLDNGRQQARLRSDAAIPLADVVADGTPSQASRAGNLLGILAVIDSAGARCVSRMNRTRAEAFDAAIRSDLANVDPKFNLELLLRRIRVVGSREGQGTGGSVDLGESLPGAGSGPTGVGVLMVASLSLDFPRGLTLALLAVSRSRSRPRRLAAAHGRARSGTRADDLRRSLRSGDAAGARVSRARRRSGAAGP